MNFFSLLLLSQWVGMHSFFFLPPGIVQQGNHVAILKSMVRSQKGDFDVNAVLSWYKIIITMGRHAFFFFPSTRSLSFFMGFFSSPSSGLYPATLLLIQQCLIIVIYRLLFSHCFLQGIVQQGNHVFFFFPSTRSLSFFMGFFSSPSSGLYHDRTALTSKSV
jgi:hypothetical protein